MDGAAREIDAAASSSPYAAQDVTQELIKIVLVGKTGCGKSSLANTIFGCSLFKISHTFNSETSKCQALTQAVSGKRITIIDTPGFFDTDRSEEEMKPEILRCITECAPGPHAFLIVLKVERITVQEKDIIKKICQYFSEEVLKYSTVIFTHGDQLPDGHTIKDFVDQNEYMRDLVKKCANRCHVIDNKYWSNNLKDEYRNNEFQVKKLLQTIQKTCQENKGSYYTNDMLQAAERAIQKQEWQIRQSSGNVTREELRHRAKLNVFEMLMLRFVSVLTNVLLRAFFGETVDFDTFLSLFTGLYE